MQEIRQYPDLVWFVVYIVFVISISLQGCSTSWVQHSYCAIPLYCQYFPNLKINYKKVFAFMLKFPVFALLMPFINTFCCRMWASRLTNMFPLIKKFMIFKGTCKKVIQVAKSNLAKFPTYQALIFKKIFHGNFLEGSRKARK